MACLGKYWAVWYFWKIWGTICISVPPLQILGSNKITPKPIRSFSLWSVLNRVHRISAWFHYCQFHCNCFVIVSTSTSTGIRQNANQKQKALTDNTSREERQYSACSKSQMPTPTSLHQPHLWRLHKQITSSLYSVHLRASNVGGSRSLTFCFIGCSSAV